jgi:putative oxidoreductase
MSNQRARIMIGIVARGLGIVLVRSALYHIENNYAFLSSVYSFKIVTAGVGLAVAAFLPYLQLTLGVALVVAPRLWRSALWMTAVLFSVYATMQIVTLARGLNISCGCFGPSSDNPIGVMSLALAVGCAFAAILALLMLSQSAIGR